MTNTINVELTLTRRRLLMGLAAAGLLPLAMLTNAAKKNNPSVNTNGDIWFSAAILNNGDFGAAWHNNGTSTDLNLPLDFRGHGSAIHPLRKNTVVLFARRPGYHGLEIDLQSGQLNGQFTCTPGRHLFGHGCFSTDGKVLFTTEADIEKGVGKIVLRDTTDYRIIGEYESYGIGPHEIRLMPDGRTLVVANGGLLTRPDSGRRILNLDTMDSFLAYIDSETGELLETVRVAEPKASLRHLDVASDGTVAVAIQVQREAVKHSELIPLAITHKRGEIARPLLEPQTVLARLQDYMGSVAISNASRQVGFTSPRGNLAVFWNLDNAEFNTHHSLHDVCGLAVSSDHSQFILSSSTGQIRALDAHTLNENQDLRVYAPNAHWDNHMVVAKSIRNNAASKNTSRDQNHV